MNLKINDRLVGPGHPTYVVAELSANHNHDFDQAVKLVKAAKRSGADAVKLQTYTPDTITIDSDKEYFHIAGGTLWDDHTLYDLYGKAYTPWEWQPRLKAVAAELGLALFSTPFDFSAVDFLEDMEVPCYKVASFELVDIPLIEKIARTGKPIIMSTGMASFEEIKTAVDAARSVGAEEIALLKCTSAYPAPVEEMNLRTIPHLAENFGVPTGLSDHTHGTVVPVVAVSLGACIVEKHFSLSRDLPGPDSAFSLEPNEFKEMVDAIRIVEKALGQVDYTVGEFESKSLIFRRSLFVVEDVEAGETFTEKNVRSIRPGHGLAPKYLEDVLGRKADRDIQRGTPFHWGLLADKK
jgi:N-acetylneuraminate synthase